MDQLDKIFFAIVALLAMVFLRKMFKNISQVALVIVVIAFIYMLFTGNANFLTNPRLENVFRNSSLSEMEQRYCEGSRNKRDMAVCSCIIGPLHEDFRNRYSPQEMQMIEANQERMNYEVERIIDQNRDYIQGCLRSKNAGRYELLDRFKKTKDIWNM